MVKFTSAEWQELIKEYLIVMDPDGWDRSPEYWDKSWNQEQLTFEEFMSKAARSTCKFYFHDFNSIDELVEFLYEKYK